MKISKLLKITAFATGVILLLNIFALFQLDSGIKNERGVKQNQIELDNLGKNLQDASDYLTNQAKAYAQFGEKIYYDNYWTEVNETQTRGKIIERLQELGVSEEDFALLNAAAEASNDLIKTEEESFAAVEDGDLEKARRLMFDNNYNDKKENINQLTLDFREQINEKASLEMNQALNKSNLLFTMIYILIILLAILIFITFFLLAKKIKKLVLITERLNILSTNDGDLTSSIDMVSKDEIGEIANSFNVFVEKVRGIVLQVSNSSKEVSTSSEELTITTQQSSLAAEEVAKVIDEIAMSASEQSRNTEEGVININALGDSIDNDLQLITQLDNSSQEVTNLIQEGFIVLDELNKASEENEEIIKEIQSMVVKTNDSAAEISSFSEMIKNIADQTNLLALNAAIEAARAGDAGRGFSVVAEEIRKLAEESTQFTNKISNIIEELISKANQSVGSMGKAESIANIQSKSVENTRNKFDGISVSINDIRDKIELLNKNGNNMNNKKNEIISIIENLSAISEENAAATQQASASVEEQTASIEEISASSESLANQVRLIMENLSQFKY